MPDIKEPRYDRLRKLAEELHIPIPEAFLTLEVFDKDGRLIQKHRQRSHSWTRNAYNALFSNLASVNMSDSTFGAGKLSGKDTGGTVRYGAEGAIIAGAVDWNYQVTSYGFRAAAANDDHGILVGSGVNAESFEDYALQTLIVEGTGADQLNYATSEIPDISYVDTTETHNLVRYCNNNSGGNVSVNEVALVCSYDTFGSSYVKILMSRDKLGATITVPDTGQLKVTYTIQLTYPA
ncbi:hypothetical protein ES703_123406 [subsurface metagenome]